MKGLGWTPLTEMMVQLAKDRIQEFGIGAGHGY